MDSDFYKEGLRFSCQRCSKCCRHSPGYVFLSQKDIQAMAAHLSLSDDKFIRKYCRIIDIGGFKRISLIEKSNYDCVFWEKGGCLVYPVRPFQCSSFPFWAQHLSSRDDWNRAASDCPGMNRGELHSFEKIEEWLKKRLKEPFITL